MASKSKVSISRSLAAQVAWQVRKEKELRHKRIVAGYKAAQTREGNRQFRDE